MINGKSIVELAQDLQDKMDKKRDFVVDTRELEFQHEGNRDFALTIPDQGEKLITDHAHSQLSARLGIPKKYYDRLRTDQPELLVDNVQTLFNKEPERRMIRTMDDFGGGVARAFLSDRYRRVDNEQIAQAALPALMESDEIEILSSEVTESRLYIQARFPKLEGAVKVGDPVQAGLIITNSEIGMGALDIRPMIYRLICTNGMVTGTTLADGRLRKNHIGRKVEGGEDYTIYSDETLKADDHALMLKIRDSIKNLSDPALFTKLMEQMRATTEGPQVVRPVRAIEELGKAFNIGQVEQESILENLMRGDNGVSDYSQWGMLNAVTRLANEHESYDRAVELEQLGGKVLDLSASQWATIAEAA